MNHDTLARQFDDAAGALAPAGHAIIVRKARALLSDGDVDGAMAFVQEASQRTPLAAISTLNSALVAWKSAGNKPKDLSRNPTWQAGSAKNGAVADALAKLPTGDVERLMGALLNETQNAGTPAADADGGTLTGPQAIGSIFGQRDTGGQPVEEASNLVAKPLALDDAPAAEDTPATPSAPPAAAKSSAKSGKKSRKSKKASRKASKAPSAAKSKTPPPAVEQPPAVDPTPDPVVEAVAKPAPPPPPAELDTTAPTSVDRPDDSSASLWVGLVIVVAAIVFLIWYTNQSGG